MIRVNPSSLATAETFGLSANRRKNSALSCAVYLRGVARCIVNPELRSQL